MLVPVRTSVDLCRRNENNSGLYQLEVGGHYWVSLRRLSRCRTCDDPCILSMRNREALASSYILVSPYGLPRNALIKLQVKAVFHTLAAFQELRRRRGGGGGGDEAGENLPPLPSPPSLFPKSNMAPRQTFHRNRTGVT